MPASIMANLCRRTSCRAFSFSVTGNRLLSDKWLVEVSKNRPACQCNIIVINILPYLIRNKTHSQCQQVMIDDKSRPGLRMLRIHGTFCTIWLFHCHTSIILSQRMSAPIGLIPSSYAQQAVRVQLPVHCPIRWKNIP